MNDGTSEPRRCEVCGDPIRQDNEYGICSGRGKPECARARDRKRQPNRPRRPRSLRKPEPRPIKAVPQRCTACGRTMRDDNLYGVCRRPECRKARRKAALVSGPSVQRAPYLVAGAVFDRLTLLEDAARYSDYIRCLCKCGNETVKLAVSVKNGITRSCRCLSRERQATQGGLSRHPLYSIWNSMIDRCTNPKVKGYHNYGGRGIKVCERWLDLRVFIEDVEREIGPRPEGVGPSGRVLYSFDRKDNDGNYEPGNVCWSTSAEQVRNQRKVAELTLELRAATQERDALAAELAALKASLE